MANRRARGTGSIFWSVSRRRYVGRVYLGRKLDGSAHYVQVSAVSELECARLMRDAKPAGPTETVGSWAERWFRGLTVRPSTRADYRLTLDRHVLPTLGHLRLSTLTAHQVSEAVRKWQSSLGPNTAIKNLWQLTGCLEAARRAQIITTNPARDAKKPKPKKTATAPFAPHELAVIAQAAGAEPAFYVFALLATVGCRSGEALALNVQDFDKGAGTVAISRTYTRKHGMRPPKSENGIRTIRVPAAAIATIRAACHGRDSGPLFVNEYGHRRNYDIFHRSWKRLLVKLGFAYRAPHQLRHSVATALISAGVPLGDCARFLGDAVQTVVSTYLHPAGTDPADELDRLFSGNKVAGKNRTRSTPLKSKRFA